MTEQEARKALAIGFTSPIVGIVLGIVLGLAIFDLFDTFEQWTAVILLALLGFSIWYGANKSGEALQYRDNESGLDAAKGAANLNNVLAIVWMVVSYFVSLFMALSAVQNFKVGPVPDSRGLEDPADYTVSFDWEIFTGEFLPAVVIVAMAMFGFVFQLVATSKEPK